MGVSTKINKGLRKRPMTKDELDFIELMDSFDSISEGYNFSEKAMNIYLKEREMETYG